MLNCVVLQGRLVAAPELKTTNSGKSVANFRVAVDRSYVKPGEERQVDFITIVVWDKTADFVSKYFNKGSMIVVQGSIQTRNYEDSNGNKRTAFEVVAREVNFCGDKKNTDTHKPAEESAFEEVAEYDDSLPF